MSACAHDSDDTTDGTVREDAEKGLNYIVLRTQRSATGV